MKTLIVVSSILALIITGFSLAIGIDIALQGALVTDGHRAIERFPGAMALISILNLTLLLDIGLTLTAAVLSLVLSARSRQWIWFGIILLLIPLELIPWEALLLGNDLRFGVLVLVLPLVTLLYSLIANTAQKNPNRAA
jgi:hypothetical protein